MTPPFSPASPWLPLTPEQVGQLAKLCLTASDFHCLRDRFVGDRFSFARLPSDHNWRLVHNRPLSNSELLRHLEGTQLYATGCRWDPNVRKHRTDYFVV